MLIEGTVGLLLIMAYRRANSKEENPTKEEEAMFLNAMEHLTVPEKLRKLAEAFDKKGYKVRAELLRKRADLRGASPEVKAQRKAILEKALKSKDFVTIEKIARKFESLTATGAAKKLREHAKKLREDAVKAKEEPIKEEVKEEAPKKEEVNGAAHVEST